MQMEVGLVLCDLRFIIFMCIVCSVRPLNNCIFFCVAGYGNVAPRTEWGKVATILYAIIGMPLFLLYLSNIGRYRMKLHVI